MKCESNDWNMADLEKALRMLKNNKCSDPNGMVNEIIKEGWAGTELKKGMLNLMNGIKRTKEFPTFVCLSDICSIWKKKGSKLEIENERGISLITIFKKCLENMLFNNFYTDLDKNMSESNLGSRKKRNLKDHLLIMNGVINSVINGKEECVNIQIFDLEKSFNSL